MNILLVYPRYPETFWSFEHALRFIGKKASIPPMGLLTVAAQLPEDWNLKLIDLNITALKDEDILWSDFVFISAMTVQKSSSRDVIARSIRLGRRVVAGGPLFTAEYKEFPEVHHLVLNESEITLPLFLHDLEHGSPKPIYQSPDWADVTTAPVPLWDLINLKNYATMCVQYSRGCPYDCEFCDITVLYGRKPRIKTPEIILSELDALYSRGWRGSVFFVDDNFIGNKRQIKYEMLPAVSRWMKEKKHPFTFFTQATINLADDDKLLRLMTESGFNSVFCGIETPNEESLIECNKPQNTRRNLIENVHKLQSYGLQVLAGFIVGFDSDKSDIFKRMSTFINESGIVTAMVGLLNAPIGTKLYKRLTKEKRIISGMTGSNTDFTLNFLPKMDYQLLLDGYRKVVNDIYKPDKYYTRIRTFLLNYRRIHKQHMPKLQWHFSFSHLRGLVTSVYKLGIKRGVRKHYWKLIMWTLMKRPHLIPIAITLAIYGDHFMKYFEITV